MGATHYSLPLRPKISTGLIKSPPVEPRKIRAVVPVHNDWSGLKTTLDSLQKMTPRPGTITVVNDNVDSHIPAWLNTYPVKIINYEGNHGPAFARNQGCSERCPEYDWIHFTDCGCEHVSNIMAHFINARDKRDHSVVAICGSTSGKGPGTINRYMTEMNILNPPFESDLDYYGEKVPQAIITANTLVYAHAFYQLSGFSIDFREAGGEDLDLGIRLRNLGTLVYEPDAATFHEFEEDFETFERRFERYGRGNWLLEQKHKLSSMRYNPFMPEEEEFRELAQRQIKSLCRGYDKARLKSNRHY